MLVHNKCQRQCRSNANTESTNKNTSKQFMSWRKNEIKILKKLQQ